ncbi:hypothetical protein J2Z31_004926 [Sinorhizobium kostiense]|uniref:Uncharacterized protein n=1 Tax=Sinorhizobium kostiense TaxID=76747 RepID=A0ABS4R675_9HYPH|nr:hypothetical protein [Sinorhizobium kostiense]
MKSVLNQGRRQRRTLRQLPRRENFSAVQGDAAELKIGFRKRGALTCCQDGALDRLGVRRDRRRCKKSSRHQRQAGAREK